LEQRTVAVEERMERLSSKTRLITPQIRLTWETGVMAPLDVPSTWLHGDLHPRNVLVENGAISGIIDWGDITSGDCATDLASIWMLFADQNTRNDFVISYGEVSEATLQRAKAWAVLFGLMLLDTGLMDNPRNAALGNKIIENIAKTGVSL
jgi:aminoglycoside phosphotransferase (APT) family kinase protein